jgi:hypothetical protein
MEKKHFVPSGLLSYGSHGPFRSMYILLVVSNTFYFPYKIWDVILPIDFSEGVKKPPSSYFSDSGHL